MNLDLNYGSSTVSSQNQIVIPKEIRKAWKLQTGDKLIWIKREKKALVMPEPKSWAEYTCGIDQESWKGVDATKYIRRLRDEEWD